MSYHDTNFDSPRAFIYQNGVMTDLNDLLSKSDQARFYISSTGGINDLGEIAAQANLVAGAVVTSTLHAGLLVPTRDREGEALPAAGEPSLLIPEEVQTQIRQRAAKRHFGH